MNTLFYSRRFSGHLSGRAPHPADDREMCRVTITGTHRKTHVAGDLTDED
jgi:hypothetical protein